MPKAKDDTTEAEAFFAEVKRFCDDHKIGQRTLSNRVAGDTYKLERMQAQREKDLALMDRFRAEMRQISQKRRERQARRDARNSGTGAVTGPS